MTLSTVWKLVNEEKFRGRIIAAVYLAGMDILHGADDPASKRYRMAQEAKDMPSMIATSFVWDVASNPSINGAASEDSNNVIDGDIEYVVATQWDAIANLRYPEAPTQPFMNPVVPLPEYVVPTPESGE